MRSLFDILLDLKVRKLVRIYDSATVGDNESGPDGDSLDTLLGELLSEWVGIILKEILEFIFEMLLDLKLGRLLRIFDNATVGNNEGGLDGIDVGLVESNLYILQVSWHWFRIWLRDQ